MNASKEEKIACPFSSSTPRQNRFAAKEWASKLAESDKAPEKLIETTADSSFTSSLASGASFLGCFAA